MIRHIVLWKLKNPEIAEIKALNASRLQDELLALKKEIVQIKRLETGVNLNPENEYDMALSMDFDNFEDLMIYQKHPAHIKVVEFLKSIRELKASIDYEIF
ncbi:MAG: Dabb family protein [Bacteroidota bacterium]